MAYKTPRVSDGGLCDDRSPQSWIPLDSPAWFAWLAAPDNVCFTYALLSHRLGYIYGFITVRKERRQRGGVYWSGYRRQGRRLRKHYLGRSAELTQARLAQAAALWETDADPPT